MNSLAATGFLPRCRTFQSPRRGLNGIRIPAAAFYTQKADSSSPGDEVLDEFWRERKLNGDFVTKFCDGIWLSSTMPNSMNLGEFDGIGDEKKAESLKTLEEDNVGGFLKLKVTNDWLLGDDNSVPMNQKIASKDVRDDREARRSLNFLRYEALKKELFLLTVGIGTACTGYCLITLSVQASVSYATGVLFSLLYFRLLCGHADSLSREAVPAIFTKRKQKKIGIRSEDLQDLLEKTVKGSSVALSSPRLVIPAAIYALWGLSQHFWHDIFDFQLVPAMVGLFAYKAAALVQVYRDNEDLQFIFPEAEDQSKWPKS